VRGWRDFELRLADRPKAWLYGGQLTRMLIEAQVHLIGFDPPTWLSLPFHFDHAPWLNLANHGRTSFNPDGIPLTTNCCSVAALTRPSMEMLCTRCCARRLRTSSARRCW